MVFGRSLVVCDGDKSGVSLNELECDVVINLLLINGYMSDLVTTIDSKVEYCDFSLMPPFCIGWWEN